MMLSVMLFITGLLLFVFVWCPLLTYLVSLIPVYRLVAHLERHVETYTDAIGYGLLFSALLAFVVGWIVTIVKLVS